MSAFQIHDDPLSFLMCQWRLLVAICCVTLIHTLRWPSGSIYIPGRGCWPCWISARLPQECPRGRFAPGSQAGQWEALSPSWPPRPPELKKIWWKNTGRNKQLNIQFNQSKNLKCFGMGRKHRMNRDTKTDLPGSLSMRSECSRPSFSMPCSGRLMTRRGLWLPVNIRTSREPLFSIMER